MGGHQPHPGLRQRRSQDRARGRPPCPCRSCLRTERSRAGPAEVRASVSIQDISPTGVFFFDSASTVDAVRLRGRNRPQLTAQPNPQSRITITSATRSTVSRDGRVRRTVDGDAVQRSAAEPRPHPDLEVRERPDRLAPESPLFSLPLNDTLSIGAAIVAVYGDASRAVEGGPISDYVWSDHQSAEVRVRHEGSGRDSRLRTRSRFADRPSSVSCEVVRAWCCLLSAGARIAAASWAVVGSAWDLPATLRELRRRDLPAAGGWAVVDVLRATCAGCRNADAYLPWFATERHGSVRLKYTLVRCSRPRWRKYLVRVAVVGDRARSPP